MQLRVNRTFVLAFVGFFLMIGAWSVAVPYDGTPDEHDHVYRAIGVVSGDVTPRPEAAVRGSGAYQTVPTGFISSMCWLYVPARTPADCPGAEPTGDRTPTRVGSGAGRYQPVYYAIVGLPLKLWPGWPGLIIARLISGAISAALLAAAVAAIMRYSRHRLMMAGLLAAVTPMITYFAGSINPNGIEMAAGVAFFAAMIPLFTSRMDRVDPALLRLAGISALWLATLRSIGLVFLFFAVVSLVLPWGAGNARQVLRVREARWWVAGVTLAAAASVVWIIAMKAGDLGDFRTGHYSPTQAVFAVVERWPNLFDQMVGMTSWLIFVFMVPAAYVVWHFLAASLLVLATVFGTWADRWRLFGLVSGGLFVPTAIQVYYMNKTGFITQGRYLLPALVGVMLMAANVLEERGLDRARGAAMTRLFVISLLPIHLLCLVTAMARWQRGLPGSGRLGIRDLNPLSGRWDPPLGSVTPLLLEIAGLAILGWLAWTASRHIPVPADGARGATGDVDVEGLRPGTRPAAGEAPPPADGRAPVDGPGSTGGPPEDAAQPGDEPQPDDAPQRGDGPQPRLAPVEA